MRLLQLFLSAVVIPVLYASALWAQSPTVATDKSDYQPGDTVEVTGFGWLTAEIVTLTFDEDPHQHPPHIFQILTDDSGNIYHKEYVIEEHDIGTTFTLTAVGQTSGLIAETTFTDNISTDPAPQLLPYSQDFSTLSHSSTSYPAGWQGWSLASSSSSSFKTTSPTGNAALNSSASSSTTAGGAHNYNGKIGFLGSGTIDPSIALAISTAGKNGITIRFDIMTIRNPYNFGTNTRINQVDLQYRVGTSSWFTSVSGLTNGIYENDTTQQTTPATTNPQNVQTVTLALPAACDDQAVVQLRWVQRDFTGSGSRPSFAVDNVSICASPACSITGLATVCGSLESTYTASGGTSYAWSVAPSGTLSSTTGSSVTVTVGNYGTYTLTLTSSTNGCSTTCVKPLAFNPVPSCTINGPEVVTKGSSSNTYTFSGSDGASFAWSISGTGTLASTTGSSVNVTAGGSGCFTLTVTATSTAGCSNPCTKTVSVSVPTALLYTGSQIINLGSTTSIALSAKLSSLASECLSNRIINFFLDNDPTKPGSGSYLLASANTDSSGVASTTYSTFDGWNEGVYTITARYDGDVVSCTTCLPSMDEACLTVASPGYAAEGGGWYTLSGNGRVNFGFTVRRVPNTNPAQYKGQCLLINNGKWRLKGALNTYSRTNNKGAASGVANLYYWNPALNGGLGAWVLSESDVAYTIYFEDDGQGGKNSSDKFGTHINHVVNSPPEPNSLPNSAATQLKGGNVTIQNARGVSSAQDENALELETEMKFIPEEYALSQNYPNPFNPSTQIQFDLPENSRVRLVIHDMLGREVITLAEGEFEAGRCQKIWSGQDRYGKSVASGVYFYRLDVFSLTGDKKLLSLKKMLLTR